jgi:probable HAF family extracellular repeat protein
VKKIIALKIFALASFLFISTAANAVQYNISVLGTLGGDSKAYALNDNGMVVGKSYNSSTSQMESAIWNGGVVQSLGVTGIARGVNNNGTVVGETGSADLFQPTGYAYSWTSSGGVKDLGTLGGAQSGAYDINEAGVITGFAWPPGAQFSTYGQGFIYQDDTMSPLGTYNHPDGYSRGHGINDSNQIAGRSSDGVFGGNPKYATYWDENQNLNQFQNAAGYSTAEQINNNGLIVGTTRQVSTGNILLAATWDTAGNEQILNAGIFGSRVWSANDSDVLVGYSQIASGADNRRAFVSFDGTNIVDLNSIIDLSGTGLVSLNEAIDINENGDIVGVGITSTGEERAFILTTAVPVPAAVWMFGSALGVLGWMRRRKLKP